MSKLLVSIAFTFAGTGFALADAGGDAEKGAQVFRKCASCHMVGEDARNRVGPHLNGIFGQPAAMVESFRYSNAMTEAGEDGLVWDYDTLSRFVENPRDTVKGTRMSFRGIADPDDRNDLVAYLRQFSDNPADIPEAAPTITGLDHSVAPEILAIVGDAAYGEYLSGECTSCHQASGQANGIPSISLWPEQDFVTALHAYKDGAREHPVMQMMASRLSNEEIAALAAYFATIDQ